MALELFEAIAQGGDGMALATIMQVQGSSPRHPGAKMLVRTGAAALGTVGGGRGEARALEACRRSLAERRPGLLAVEMLGTRIGGQDLVCGGTTTLLIEPLDDPEPYRLALERLAKGERVLFVKRVIGTDAEAIRVEVRLLDEGGTPIHGRLDRPGERAASQALDRGRAWYDAGAGVFYDPVFPEEKLLVLGGGHVGQALAAQAVLLGFAVTVVDDRREFLAAGRFPKGVRTVHGAFEPAIAAFPFDSATYAVVVTRGHQFDLECVRALLHRPYRYAGCMGSALKTRLLVDQVLQDGFDPAKVGTLCAPIGLDIGAETPEELANAILGELIVFRRNARTLPELMRVRESRRA